jgi:3-deoxy-D-manno-octulosonate 8-phosphate phosphatase (KDO 8-P phosphatase)
VDRVVTLERTEAARRARAIKLVLTDCDGVLTDNGVYYGDSGEVLKRFSIRDGMGVERLRAHGIETGIVTGELSLSIRKRAEKLRIDHCHQGIKDKRALLDRLGVPLEELAYIGDDVNDLGIARAIGEVGLIGVPSDGMPEFARVAHHRCSAPGGHGAFRDFAEWIIGLRANE